MGIKLIVSIGLMIVLSSLVVADIDFGLSNDNKPRVIMKQTPITFNNNTFGANTTSTASWTRTGTDVHLTNIGDNVGIGTASPEEKLDVVGDAFKLADNRGAIQTKVAQIVMPHYDTTEDDVFILSGTSGVTTSNLLWGGGIIGFEGATSHYFYASPDSTSLGNLFYHIDGPKLENVFNSAGTTLDFRVESDNKEYMFYINGSTDRVGIGTSAPTHELNVVGDVNVTGVLNATDICTWDGTCLSTGSASDGSINSSAWNSTSFSIYPRGNISKFVGIGTATPTKPLHIIGDVRVEYTTDVATARALSIVATQTAYNRDMGALAFTAFTNSSTNNDVTQPVGGIIGFAQASDINGSMTPEIGLKGGDFLTSIRNADRGPAGTGNAITINGATGLEIIGVQAALHGNGANTTVNNSYGIRTMSVTMPAQFFPNANYTVNKGYGLYVRDPIKTTAVSTVQMLDNYGLYLEKMAQGTSNNYGIVLAGDGAGSDILFGTDQDASINFDGTNLVINPQEFGSGNTVFSSGLVGIGTSTPTHELNVVGNQNLTGNFTGNQYYGEMWFLNSSADGRVTVISTANTWTNITGFRQGANAGQSLNGFTFNDVNNGSLTCNIAGKYKLDYSISFGREGGVAREFNIGLSVNGEIQNNTVVHRIIGSGGDVGNAGSTGFVDLVAGDEITLMLRNEGGTENAEVHNTNVNLMRIGN